LALTKESCTREFPTLAVESRESRPDPLQFSASDINVVPATPDKRRGPCMSRRGQVGTIAVSGRWYVVRFWKYLPGQDRIHASERICPIDPKAPGYLPKGERRRRANEIVEASGVNDAQKFIQTHNGVTFREQAEWFINNSERRRRKPAKPKTIEDWRYCLEKWLNPNLGDLPLAGVNNAAVKPLVAKMAECGLSPKSIETYIGLVKLIVASALDEDGNELFPRKWNHEFMDMPMVEKQKQRRPAFDAQTVSAIVKKTSRAEQVLYALLAGSGLRIGEALGLEIRHISPDRRAVTVEQSCWRRRLQEPKTRNAYRQVDLCSPLAGLLKSFIGNRQSGLLFQNRKGKPLCKDNLRNRSLHRILEELKVEKTGFHAMRRFRATWLRKQGVPEDLIKFWLGHAEKSVTDGYSRLREDVEFRGEVAEKIGTGFALPAPMRPMRPKISNAEKREVTA
jgi:site-specific recombinase XerD